MFHHCLFKITVSLFLSVILLCPCITMNLFCVPSFLLLLLYKFPVPSKTFTFRRPLVTPYYFVCPGVNDSTSKLNVKLGVMLSLPRPDVLERAGLNQSDGLIPGENLIPLSHIAQAANGQAEVINRDGVILPDHHLCLFYTFVPSDLQDITTGSNYIYAHSGVYQTINALYDSHQFKVHRDLMVSFGTMVNVQALPHDFVCPQIPNAFNDIFRGGPHNAYDQGCELGVFDTNMDIQVSSLQLVKGIKLLVEALGWRRYGILTSCSSQEIWQNQKRGIFLSHFDGDFDKYFKQFQENEIRVIVFIGSVCDSLDFLIQAFDKEIALSKKFVIILAVHNFSPVSHFTKSINEVCSKEYSLTEINKIKIGLERNIVLQPQCPHGYNWSSASSQSHLTRLDVCLQGFMADAVAISSQAANDALEVKSSETGINKTLLTIGKEDYIRVTDQLKNTSCMGYTGLLQFDQRCHRIANSFVASNFYCGDDYSDSNFSNCFLTHRANVFTNWKYGKVEFFDENGTFSIESTFVFKDNTSTVPEDAPKRRYVRSNMFVYSTILGIVVFFIVVTSAYIALINWQDVNALIYSGKWLIKQEEVKFATDSSLQIMSSMKWSGKFNSSDFSSTTGLYNNRLVQVHKQSMQIGHLTVPMRKELLKAIKLSHRNLSSFIGCITKDETLTGVLYEHTTRGSLHQLLLKPSFEMNETFRVSFTLGAVNGLHYLHSKGVFHCRLNSLNCLIDEYWCLKLTNFGLQTFHSNIHNEKCAVNWEAPECRLLGSRPNKKSDIYSLGTLIKEIGCRQSLLTAPGLTESQLEYDPDLPPVYTWLVLACTNYVPKKRATLDEVKAGIKSISSENNTAETENLIALETYSKNLEKMVENTSTRLQAEKERVDTILLNYIPKPIVNAARKSQSIPVREYRKAVLIYIKLNNFERLTRINSKDKASGIISNVDKTVDNICKHYQLERMQYTGSVWVYLGGVYHSTVKTSPVINAAEAALNILNTFETNNDQGISTSIAIHSGPLFCGMVIDATPIHIAGGETYHKGLCLLSFSPPGEVLISEEFKRKLEFFEAHDERYRVEDHGPITMTTNKEHVSVYSLTRESDSSGNMEQSVSNVSCCYKTSNCT